MSRATGSGDWLIYDNSLDGGRGIFTGLNNLTDIYWPTPPERCYQRFSGMDLELGNLYLPWNAFNVDEEEDLKKYQTGVENSISPLRPIHFRKLEFYDITYDLDGGDMLRIPSSCSGLDAKFTLKTPTKAGYTFKGWTGSNGTTPQTTVEIKPKKVTSDLTYTANWEKAEHTLTIKPNGGKWDNKTTDSTKTIAEGETETIADATGKTGYNFDGWECKGSGSRIDPTTKVFTMGTEDAEIKAKWKVIEYTITYNLGGGTNGEGNPAKYTIETNTITLSDPTRTGYTFTGWTGENGTTPQKGVQIAKGSTGNKTYTANWEAIDYTITYELGGGTNGEGNPGTYTVETNTITLKDPSRTGYKFTGWTGSNGTTPQKGIQIAKGSTGNKTYTANWEKAEHTLTIKPNGGKWDNKTTDSTKTIAEGETETIADATGKTGYNFDGWECKGAKSSINKTTKVFTMGTEDAEIKAKWEAIDYTITYELGGGTNGEGNPGTYTVDTNTITLLDPTRTGYKFTGWTGSNGTTPQKGVQIAKGSTGNKTYTANWEAIDYTITYELGGGTNGEGNPGTYTVDTNTITLLDPTRTGYTFTGWTGSNGNIPQKGVQIAKGSTGEKNYTANWEAKEYTVTLKTGTGIERVTGNGTYTYGQSVTITAELKENTAQYTYGWTNWTGTGVSSSNKRTYTFTMPDGNVTLTANGTETINTYLQTVKIRYQEANGNYGTYSNVINRNYNYGETISWDTSRINGFDTNTYKTASIETYTVTGAKTTEISIDRKTYDVTVNAGTGIERVGGGNTYRVGQKVEVTATPKAGYTWANWTALGINNSNKQTYQFNMPTAAVSLTANATINTYDIRYNLNEGQVTGNPETYTVETNTITLRNPTRAGYNFRGWTGSNGTMPQTTVTINKGSTEDKNYTANWEARTDTPYIVQHWKQTIVSSEEGKTENNGGTYELDTNATQHLTGTTDTQGTGQVRQYEGFTSPPSKTVTIKGDGTAVLNYYYTRNKYTLKLTNKKGIAAVLGGGTYPYQKDITINAIIYAGYKWDKWTGRGLKNEDGTEKTEMGDIKNKFNMPANDVEYETAAIPDPNTKYTIKHWKQKLGGNAEDWETGYMEPPEIVELTGETDSRVNPPTKDYPGFRAPEADGISVPITGEGTLIVDYYYKRNQYEVKLNKGKGIKNIRVIGNISGEGKDKYLYEETVRIEAEVEEGYTWSGWTGEENDENPTHQFTIGLKNVEYTANATPNENTPYIVQHWQQNLPTENNETGEETNNYTLIEKDTEHLTGTTDTQTNTRPREYEGFITPEIKNENIRGDRKTVVNYYYERKKDLSCTIKYIDKDTKETIEEKEIENQTYETEIDGTQEIKEIENYNYDSIEPEKLKIEDRENTIKIYYTKKEGKVKIHHYIYKEKTNEYTTEKLVEDEEIIGKIGEEYTTEKTKEIPENYVVLDETPENYKGQIQKEEIEISYYYKLKTPKIEGEVGSEIIEGGEKTEDGKWKITAGEEIKYRIRYNTQIEEYKGKIKIEVKAILPQGTRIDQEKCDFSEGTYEEESNTIIWTKEIAEINTFQNGTYADGINKEITIVYAEDYIVDELAPKVIGKTLLYYPDDYIIGGGGEGETPPPPFVDDETDGTGKIIIHHYIYNAEENKYTEKRIAPDEEIIEKIGNKYSTRPSIEIPINYTCINEEPEGYAGTITRKTQEISYYYKLKTPETTGSTDSEIITGIGKDEDGNYIITAGQEVKYKIKYETKIKDYKGKALIEVKAQLPEGTGIQEEKCDLAGGTYNKETNTITWTKQIENIDTFAHIGETTSNNNPDNTTDVGAISNRPQYINGIYVYEFEKEITIVYANDYILKDAKPKVTGKTKLYYPDEDPDKGGQVITGGGKIITHHYIYNEKTNEETDIKIAPDEETIKEIGSKYTTKPSEKIPANYECINKQPENYKGTTKEGTTEISYYYKIKEPTIDTSAGAEIIEGIEQTEDGKWQITAGQPVKYKIKYKTEIEDYIGRAKVEIKAQLPEGTEIEQESCDFAEGTYDEATNTITWTKEIENIDTYIEGTYILEIEKEITIIYANDYILEDAKPKVTGKTTLYYPEGHPGGKDEILGQEETDGKGKIIIHHYIYDEKTDTYTKQKLTADEQQKGEIGQEYQTTPSNKIPANYECINEQPEGYTGRYTIETIKINYYYKLKTPEIESETKSEIISGITKDENGNDVIKKGQPVKYKIEYKTKIKDYKGKALIEIKAELPEGTGIDQRKSKLEGGTYDKETNTITWTKQIENIDTFAHIGETTSNNNPDNTTDVGAISNRPQYINGIYVFEFEKEITIYYDNNYTVKDANLNVTGRTILYYPDDYPIGGKDEILKDTETKEKGKIKINHYIYDEQDNKHTTKELAPSEEITKEIGQEYETKPTEKIPANYECINTEPEGHKGTIEKGTKEINYYYKLKTPTVESDTESSIISGGKQDQQGNWEITKGEPIKYEIKYTSKIKDYKGKALIEVKAQLPEGTGIQEEKCDLAGGTYNKETNTITWTKQIENIDTFAHIGETTSNNNPDNTTDVGAISNRPQYINGIYVFEFEKEITIYYDNNYTVKDANLNVTGRTILYYPDDYPEKGGQNLKEEEKQEQHKKSGSIIIHHYIYDEQDQKETQEKIAPDEQKIGKIGDTYQTEPAKQIPENYECTNEKPEGYIGTIEKKPKEITYYYKLIKQPTGDKNGNGNEGPIQDQKKEGKIIIKYVDIDTEQEIIVAPDKPEKETYRYEIKDTIGKEYETEEKEIPYYILVKKPENAKGEIKEEEQTVTYYYRKQDFNIGIEKTIDTINLNGKNVKISNKQTAKLELKKEEIKQTELIVKYNIKITNKGELGGTAKIQEIIPEGYEIAYLPEEWKTNRDGTLEAKVEIEAGETKNLNVVLRWKNEEKNLGAKTNIAKIEESKNEANFGDTNEEDNIGEATIVLSIKTGEVVSAIIIVILLTSLGIISYITIVTIRKKEPDTKEIKFLK